MLLWLKPEQLKDEDEKAAKLQRQARIRAQKRINILGLVCVFIFIAIAQIDQKNYVSPKLRRGSNSSSKGKAKEEVSADNDDFFSQDEAPALPSNSIYSLEYPRISGEIMSLADLVGKKLSKEGFSVLAFPTNDFQQELGSNEEIAQFWKENFPEATFPIFQRSSLGENQVYSRLKEQLPEDVVGHNFFKYLVGKDGVAVKMYSKRVNPESLEEDIQQLLHSEVNA